MQSGLAASSEFPSTPVFWTPGRKLGVFLLVSAGAHAVVAGFPGLSSGLPAQYISVLKASLLESPSQPVTPVTEPPAVAAEPVPRSAARPERPIAAGKAPALARSGDAPVAAMAPDVPAGGPSRTSAADAAAIIDVPRPQAPASSNAGYLHNPAPAYPMAARRAGQEGTVMLRVLVSREGLPARVELDRSSGSAGLDAAAQNAVRGWRFAPARQGTDAIESWMMVPVVFRLRDAS